MDWTYKHFTEEAVFNAPVRSVLEAAREVVSGAGNQIEEAADGFTARGSSGFHATTATFQASSIAGGTQLKVELLVRRYSALWGFILWDPFRFYSAHVDKWFAGIAARLGPSEEQAVVSKSTMSYRVQRGCLAGCVTWLVAGACLGTAGVAADQALFPQIGSSIPGPFAAVASLIAIVVGVLTFLYVRYPDGSVATFVRSHLPRKQDGGAQ